MDPNLFEIGRCRPAKRRSMRNLVHIRVQKRSFFLRKGHHQSTTSAPQQTDWAESYGLGFSDPVIPLGFQFQRQLLAARLHDPAVKKDVDLVRLDVIEEALIVGDDQDAAMLAAQGVDAAGDDAQSIDVQARVSLIEDT